MKNVRLKLEDDLHRRVRTVAVSSGLTLEQAMSVAALLYAERGERTMRAMSMAQRPAQQQQDQEGEASNAA